MEHRSPARLGLVLLFLATCDDEELALPIPSPALLSIPIEVLEPAQRGQVVKNFPAAVGLVFEDQALSVNDPFGVRDSAGRDIAFDSEVTGWWDKEKTRIKWLLLRFKADTDLTYAFVKGAIPQAQGPSTLATQSGDTITVDTGPLKIVHNVASGRLFDAVELNGTPMVSEISSPHVLVLDENGVEESATLSSWSITIQETSAERAVLRARGSLVRPGDGQAAARLDLRYEFFKGESFVRISHTLVWLVQSQQVRARQISLQLGLSEISSQATVCSGKSDYTAEAASAPFASATVYQDDAGHYSFEAAGTLVDEGAHHGGWLSVQGADGRGVAVMMRNFWQMYPKAFRVEGGQLAVDFWPAAAAPMGFDYESIIPEDFYYAPEWKLWSFSKATGHATSEYYSENQFTGKGVARTHELVFHFFDQNSVRSAAELNSLTQHPMVLRQDPESALKVPILGLKLSPVNVSSHPDVEKAVETIGQLNTARWDEMHDYGFWRFGMLRWGSPGQGLYRWFDGTQYGLQIIPWILFLRGGDREFFEEGLNVSQYAMDVSTNHASTNPAVPSGYQAHAALMPFPVLYPTWASHATKKIKLHFLRYYYHLTGDLRARETMEEVIAGAKWDAKTNHATLPWPELNPAVSAREVFNVNTFWADAYQETWDEEVKTYAERWMANTLSLQYSTLLRTFRFPNLYLFDGLVNYHETFGNYASDGVDLEDAARDHLEAFGYPGLQDGGVAESDLAIGALWAYQKWGDCRYASVAFDVARGIADVVPVIDLKTAKPSDITFTGDSLYRRYLMPLLAGLAAADQAGLSGDHPLGFSDTYMTVYDPNLDADASDNASFTQATAYLRPNVGGDLPVDVRIRGTWGQEFKPVRVSVFDEQNKEVTATTIENLGWPDLSSYVPPNWSNVYGSLTIPSATQGTTYRIVLVREHAGLDATANYGAIPHDDAKFNDVPFVILADAKIVYQASTSSADTFLFQTTSTAPPALMPPPVVYLRSVDETVTLWTRNIAYFTLRDAATWEVVYRTSFPDKGDDHSVSVGANRDLVLVVEGDGLVCFLKGFSPWVSPKENGWFDPTLPP